MVRPYLLAAAFVAGIAVGVVITRMTADAPRAEAPASTVPTAQVARQSDTAPSVPGDWSATPSTATAAASTRAEAASPAKPAPVAAAPVEAATTDSGTVVQPIDAGDVFNKMIAQPSQPGFENSLGEAHRALERETRDEGWAYTMESEIQNAMVNEVSTGAFRSEHLECRATMCELRLSGKGEQAAAIKRWREELDGQPFGQRLFLNYSSSISDNNRVDTIMIFRRPPKK
jgi:hypothetical protein